MKTCSKCHTDKALGEFYARKSSADGLHGQCKECMDARVALWRSAHPEKHLEYGRNWAKSNPEKTAGRRHRWRLANPGKHCAQAAQHRAKYPEKVAARDKGWRERNPDKVARLHVLRRTAEAQASVPWADQDKILNFYEMAQWLTKANALGTKWHVDHIVPLRSKVVCGLHVHTNLQVIPAAVNLRKGNKHNEV